MIETKPYRVVWQGYTSNDDSVCILDYNKPGDGRYRITMRNLKGSIVFAKSYELYSLAEARAIELCK